MAICFFRNSKTGRRSWTLGNSSIRRSRSSSASSRMAIAGFAASSMVWVHDLERVWWHRVVDHYRKPENRRSEEHTSELQSLMRISYAVFCLKKKLSTNDHVYH